MRKKREKSDLAVVKRFCKVVPINNFQRQICSSNCFEDNRENAFEIDTCLPI